MVKPVREYYDYYGVPLPMLADGEMALGAVICLKQMDHDGSIVYREYLSPGLHAVEGLGMLETHCDTLRYLLMAGRHRATE